MSRWNAIFLLIGIVALSWLVYDVGVASIAAGLARVGWGFPLACLANLGSILCDAYAFKLCAGEPGSRVSYWHYARASLAGHGINQITPVNLGEISKFSLMREHLPADKVAAALILDNLLMFFAGCLFLGVLPPIALLTVGSSGAAVWIVMGASGISLLLGCLAFTVMMRGLGRWPFWLARKLRISEKRVADAAAWWDRVEGMWRTAARDRKRMWTAFFTFIVSRLFNVLEMTLLLGFLGYADALPVAFLFLANSQVIAWLTPFIPGQTGSAEGGGWLLFRLLGRLPKDGIIVALLLKLRRVVFVGIAVAILGTDTFWHLLRKKPQSDELADATEPTSEPSAGP